MAETAVTRHFAALKAMQQNWIGAPLGGGPDDPADGDGPSGGNTSAGSGGHGTPGPLSLTDTTGGAQQEQGESAGDGQNDGDQGGKKSCPPETTTHTAWADQLSRIDLVYLAPPCTSWTPMKSQEVHQWKDCGSEAGKEEDGKLKR